MNNTNLNPLVHLIELEKKARNCGSLKELFFLMLNQTSDLVPYRQGVLFEGNNLKPEGVSGVSDFDPDSPFIIWLRKVVKNFINTKEYKDSKDIFLVNRDLLPEKLQKDWSSWLPSRGCIIPFFNFYKEEIGFLFIARETEFNENEVNLISYLSQEYSHSWDLLLRPRSRLDKRIKKVFKKSRMFIVLLIFLAGFIPVRLSTLAPGEIVAKDPWIIRSPLNGVVKKISVNPNSDVKKGAHLVELEQTELKNKLAIAKKKKKVAEARYKQTSQKAVYDLKSKSRLAVLKSRLKLADAEIDYMKDLLERTEIKAEQSGIAVYSDPEKWRGRPVKTGEKILSITDPDQVKLEIWLSVDNAVNLKTGSEVKFFLAVAPSEPLDAKLTMASYKSVIRPDKTAVYRLEADLLNKSEKIRIGLTGTAKIYGREVSLWYYLLRRPLAYMRQWLGF